MEEFVYRLSGLPIIVNRNLRLMKELDTKLQNNLLPDLDSLQAQYLALMKNPKKAQLEQKQLLERIEEAEKQCKTFSEEKISLAD